MRPALIAVVFVASMAWAEGPWKLHVIDDFSSGADGARLGDINGDGRPDIVTGWEEGGLTRLYVNPGPAKVQEKWPAVTVGKAPNVEDAVFVDLDGDGNLDVVSCCEGNMQAILVHWGPDRAHWNDEKAWVTEVLPASKGGMRWMFAMPMQVDGKHGRDLVAAGKGSNAQLVWFEAPPKGKNLGRYSYHTIWRVGWVMSIRSPDMDGDGDADLLISDRKGGDAAVRWLENPGPGPAQSKTWRSHLVSRREEAGTNYMFLDTGDIDGDGLEDVVYAAYAKESAVVVARRKDATGRKWEETVISLQPHSMGRAKAVCLGDLDGDGDSDVAVSCETAKGKHGVAWFSREENGRWRMHEVSGTERGIKFDRIELFDLDADGDLDLLTCEENDGAQSRGLGVIWYENPANPVPGR